MTVSAARFRFGDEAPATRITTVLIDGGFNVTPAAQLRYDPTRRRW